jgi:hypothetical protein
MLERYSCNRNVTLSRASCVLCSISATTRWGLDRSYLAHKRMPHGLYRHRPCATVLTLGPLLACASVILRTGLQPSTLRERCRGLDAVSFGEVLQHAQGTHQGRADLGLQLRLGLTFHEFLHGKSCDWFRHGSRRAPASTNYCTLRAGHGHVVAPRPSSWARSARRTPMRYHCHCWERVVCFLPRTYQRSRPCAEHALTPTVIKGMATVLFPTTLLVLNCYHPYSRQCLVITAGIFQHYSWNIPAVTEKRCSLNTCNSLRFFFSIPAEIF